MGDGRSKFGIRTILHEVAVIVVQPELALRLPDECIMHPLWREWVIGHLFCGASGTASDVIRERSSRLQNLIP
jgi:hypothetical protein